MSSYSLHFSASAIYNLVLSAIGILTITILFLSIRIYHKYKEATNDFRSVTIQDCLFAGAVVLLIPVLAGLPISFGSDLPISVDVPSSIPTKIAASSNICSTITIVFCRWDVAVFYHRLRGGSHWKAAAFALFVVLLSVATITLNILEWTIRRVDMHVFATAYASIRILITVVVLVRLLFTPELWKMKITLKTKIPLISMLICATGVVTISLTGIQLKNYLLDYKKEGLSPKTLLWRILEADLNVVFICFPQALKIVRCWLGKSNGATGEHISLFSTPQDTLRSELSEEGHDVEVLGGQSSESFR